LDAAGYLTSGDYILFEGAGTHDGGWQGDLDGTARYDENDTGGTYIPSGYAYIRVFNIPYGTTPTVGTWFIQSELVVVDNEQTNVPPDIPDSVDIAPTQGSGVMDQQVAIPEPASLALLGVGAVALMLRRRR
ncbi:MAG TPA: PEP-CTERM sorting domain-containing protein, partial [Kiritimatiellae bacterium]|nr:PEP-CTERM sorting domain-containing protein [Kiritimatiellia bacterium]